MDSVRYYDGCLEDLVFNLQDIYSLMGYDSHLPDYRITEIVDDVLTDLKDLIKLRYGYVLVKGHVCGPQQLRLGNYDFFPGQIITHAMKNADFYAIFTATIGDDFDLYMKKIKQRRDLLYVFVTDTIGSVLAESTVSLLMSKLNEMAEMDNMKISNNYSPGYCDWLLTEQSKLFQLLPTKLIGVHLTKSSLMLPIKTVSGIVAIGNNVIKRAYGCDICKMSFCVKNKKKFNHSSLL